VKCYQHESLYHLGIGNHVNKVASTVIGHWCCSGRSTQKVSFASIPGSSWSVTGFTRLTRGSIVNGGCLRRAQDQIMLRAGAAGRSCGCDEVVCLAMPIGYVLFGCGGIL
jgi:hypothetical protein